MADFPNQFRSQMGQVFSRLTAGQKMMIGVAGVVVIGALIGVVTLVNRPVYATLFNNLSPQDASKIVEKLREQEIPYQLEADGKTILVPKQNLYELRLSLAGEGLPQSSVIGYEIFDRTNLGVSEFVQKINYRRALEGELARTILQLGEVEGARVHIVVPEKTLFKEDEKPATASIVLKLRSGKPLKREATQGIAHLVSSSVEGLEASNVTILDSRGILLSEEVKPNSVAAMTASQYEMQRNVETYLAQKAQSILEGVVGRGNAIVQANAELDFRKVERTLEQYDPEKTAVLSEQLSEEKTTVGDSLPPSTRSNSITNYEVNKTVEHIVENVGNLKRLSVAAIVNGTPVQVKKGTETVTEVTPRSREEMEQLTDIVKKAVGFNTLRNDEVSVVNLPFGTGLNTEGMMYKESPDAAPVGDNDMIQKILLIVAMIGAVVILRSLLNGLKKRAVAVTGVSAMDNIPLAAAGRMEHGRSADISLPPVEAEISTEAMLRAEKRKRVESYLHEKPVESTRLLKLWLTEE